MVDLGSVTFFLVYHESFLLSSTKLLKLIDMGNVCWLPTIDVVKELGGNRFLGLNRRWPQMIRVTQI